MSTQPGKSEFVKPSRVIMPQALLSGFQEQLLQTLVCARNAVIRSGRFSNLPRGDPTYVGRVLRPQTEKSPQTMYGPIASLFGCNADLCSFTSSKCGSCDSRWLGVSQVKECENVFLIFFVRKVKNAFWAQTLVLFKDVYLRSWCFYFPTFIPKNSPKPCSGS